MSVVVGPMDHRLFINGNSSNVVSISFSMLPLSTADHYRAQPERWPNLTRRKIRAEAPQNYIKSGDVSGTKYMCAQLQPSEISEPI